MKKLFVDFFGTLAIWEAPASFEGLFAEGWLMGLKPQEQVVAAVKSIVAEYADVEVFVIAEILADNQHSVHETNVWLDKFLPEVDSHHRLFCPATANKAEDALYATEGFSAEYILLDDCVVNITAWQAFAGTGILVTADGAHVKQQLFDTLQ